MLLADGAELFYILAVAVIVGLSVLFERFKSVMDTSRREPRELPRPNTRRHPTSLPRPEIPPLPETAEQRPRETARPPVPRPTARPPVAQPRAGGSPEIRRAGTPRRPASTPPAPRSLEERKAIIRGESAAQRPVRTARDEVVETISRAARAPSSPPAPAVQPRQEKESWARLTQLGEEVAARTIESRVPLVGQLSPASAEPAAQAAAVAASIQHLTPADLRSAFILKEILEPPIALRDE